MARSRPLPERAPSPRACVPIPFPFTAAAAAVRDGILALPTSVHSLPGNGTRLTGRWQERESVARTKEAGAVSLELTL